MRDRLFILTALAASVAAGLLGAPASAANLTVTQLPGQGRVVSGQVSVGHLSAGNMDLTLNGPAVIDWGKGNARGDINAGGVAGFNIGSGAKVNFGGTAGAAVLNIDSSGNPSQILGALDAHGVDVFVANGNGIIVGAKAQILSDRTVGLIGNRLLPGATTGFNGSSDSIQRDGRGGDVTVLTGAFFGGGGRVLIAGGGNVNVDLGAFAGPLELAAGRATSRGGTNNGSATLSVSGRQRGRIDGFSSAGSATNRGVLSLAGAQVDGRLVNEGTLTLANGFAIRGKLENRNTLDANGNVTVGALNNKGLLTTQGVLTSRGWVINSGRIESPTAAGALRSFGQFTNSGRIQGVSYLDVSRGSLVNTGAIALVDANDTQGSPGAVMVRGGDLVNGGSITSVMGANGKPLYADLIAQVTNGSIRNRGLLSGFGQIATGSDTQSPNFRADGDYSISNAGTIRGNFTINANFSARLQDNASTGSFSNTGVLDLRAPYAGAGRSLWINAQTNVDLGGRVWAGGKALGETNALDGVLIGASTGRLTIATPLVFYANGSNSGTAYLTGQQVHVAANVIGLGKGSAIYLTTGRASGGGSDYTLAPGAQLKAGAVHVSSR
ncbi:MAG TPA: filamentous hemagglutinin N-terminal domain-containing protein [Frateuria sp.]|uniref:filamentous hemagglutinin N-terminal domain-containing protein n=1 Tax=Frateuria sp. TaxID=2211372 RepID=UPI002DE5A325|nr:filamentous hemagglutinin N-terminal domain-containing protein [Frateuria sp.]